MKDAIRTALLRLVYWILPVRTPLGDRLGYADHILYQRAMAQETDLRVGRLEQRVRRMEEKS